MYFSLLYVIKPLQKYKIIMNYQIFTLIIFIKKIIFILNTNKKG